MGAWLLVAVLGVLLGGAQCMDNPHPLGGEQLPPSDFPPGPMGKSTVWVCLGSDVEHLWGRHYLQNHLPQLDYHLVEKPSELTEPETFKDTDWTKVERAVVQIHNLDVYQHGDAFVKFFHSVRPNLPLYLLTCRGRHPPANEVVEKRLNPVWKIMAPPVDNIPALVSVGPFGLIERLAGWGHDGIDEAYPFRMAMVLPDKFEGRVRTMAQPTDPAKEVWRFFTHIAGMQAPRVYAVPGVNIVERWPAKTTPTAKQTILQVGLEKLARVVKNDKKVAYTGAVSFNAFLGQLKAQLSTNEVTVFEQSIPHMVELFHLIKDYYTSRSREFQLFLLNASATFDKIVNGLALVVKHPKLLHNMHVINVFVFGEATANKLKQDLQFNAKS